jgi:molybdopterin-guanine dinucleotide biosynthesis protein A
VVLAGGRGRRLGGVDKPGLTVGGRTLLDGVLAACRGAEPMVVVGPWRPTATAVRWEREEPPHGGPLAALAAGLRAVPPEVGVTALLAADLPNLGPHTLGRLRAALRESTDGAVLVDEAGRPQWLCGVWRTVMLRAALDTAGELTDRPLRAVLATLAAVRVAAEGAEAFDVDTTADLRALRSEPG